MLFFCAIIYGITENRSLVMKNSFKGKVNKKLGAAALTLSLLGMPLSQTACFDDSSSTEENEALLGTFQDIDIFGYGNIPSEKVTEMMNLLNDAWDYDLNSSEKTKFKSSISEIHIKSGTGSNFDAITGIFTIHHGDVHSKIVDVIFDDILYAKAYQKNNIMLAKYKNLKGQVLAQMKQIEAEKVKA